MRSSGCNAPVLSSRQPAALVSQWLGLQLEAAKHTQEECRFLAVQNPPIVQNAS